MPVLAATIAKLTSHTPPTAASPSTAGCCHWLTPSSAHGPPSACQDRIHSITSHQLGTTSSAAAARAARAPPVPSPAGGPSSSQALIATGIHSAPSTIATSSRAGPMLGVSQ
jgi:hypothetical protein